MLRLNILLHPFLLCFVSLKVDKDKTHPLTAGITKSKKKAHIRDEAEFDMVDTTKLLASTSMCNYLIKRLKVTFLSFALFDY
mmetsp:Transcript_40762/g.44217  ORF Transcript_40762/g.44217 Transcript_40762/m.44217 type:complete len:82 (+) Transcript_40762:1700-1945(+)